MGSQISKVLPLLSGLQGTQARVDEGRAEVQEELGWGRCGVWSPRQATGTWTPELCAFRNHACPGQVGVQDRRRR